MSVQGLPLIFRHNITTKRTYDTQMPRNPMQYQWCIANFRPATATIRTADTTMADVVSIAMTATTTKSDYTDRLIKNLSNLLRRLLSTTALHILKDTTDFFFLFNAKLCSKVKLNTYKDSLISKEKGKEAGGDALKSNASKETIPLPLHYLCTNSLRHSRQ